MIQRIQTIYLAVSLICCILLFVFPVWQLSSLYPSQSGMDVIGAGTHFLILPVAALLVISHVISIFLFKNRKRQKQFCTGNILLYIIFILWAMLLLQLEHNVFQNFRLSEFRLGIVLPFIGIVLNVLARKSIKKDDELIRSMDRLR